MFFLDQVEEYGMIYAKKAAHAIISGRLPWIMYSVIFPV
jgi:hypothetical protein